MSDGERTTEELLAYAVRQARRIQETRGCAALPALELTPIGDSASDEARGGPRFTGKIMAGSSTLMFAVQQTMPLRQLAEEMVAKVDAETLRLVTALGRATVNVRDSLDRKRLESLEHVLSVVAAALPGEAVADFSVTLGQRVRAVRQSRDNYREMFIELRDRMKGEGAP